MEILASLATLLVMVLPAVGILAVRDRATRRQRSPEQFEREEQEWRTKLSHPNWSLVEGEFGGTVPELIKRRDGTRTSISCFGPLTDECRGADNLRGVE